MATICELRGRTRGAGGEFALATDIRFASEKAILGQFAVGVGAVRGGGPMARLGRLVGRGQALEILLGGDDIPAALAAEYGYVNRVMPDTEIEDFTDAFARRIATFDKVAVTGIKQLVDVATRPDQEEFAAELQAYFATAGRSETGHSSSFYWPGTTAARRCRDRPRHHDRSAADLEEVTRAVASSVLPHPSGKPGVDLLEQPPIAIRIVERGVRQI